MNTIFERDDQPPRRKRADASGISLSEHDAAIAKGMLLRGDAQHAIAAYFGVNPGRIAEVAAGDRFCLGDADSGR